MSVLNPGNLSPAMFPRWQRRRRMFWAPDRDGITRDVTNILDFCLALGLRWS